MTGPARPARTLLLLGGGHSHLIAAPIVARSLPANTRVLLVAPSEQLLYSGMMPGWLAGEYAFEECVIDLRKVLQRHAIAWQSHTITDIDFSNRLVVGEHGEAIPYDWLSINVGSANELGRLGRGAPAIFGAKPFVTFVEGWRSWTREHEAAGGARRLVVVGIGAAGVEIGFAMNAWLRARPQFKGSTVTLVGASRRVLPGLSAIAAALARSELQRQSIAVTFGEHFVGAEEGALLTESGRRIDADLVVVATGAKPPVWLARAAARHGLALDAEGGVAVDSSMRSVSDPHVFASGDCAGFVEQKVARSGVLALRQGAVLGEVLRAQLHGEPLPRYVAQRRALALLNCCNGKAIGSWGAVGFSGRWVHRWKDHIDRRFVQEFSSPG